MRHFSISCGISIFILVFFCGCGQAESLGDALESTLSGLPLQEWQSAYDQAFPQGEDFHTLILRLARGEMRLDAETLLRSMASRFFGSLTPSISNRCSAAEGYLTSELFHQLLIL